MTTESIAERVLSFFEGESGRWAQIHRNGHLLLALPPGIRGARRGLSLYQPQRFKARVTIKILRCACLLGLHRMFLPSLRCHGGIETLEPPLPEARPCTTAILLGSPEHKIKRAIASYQTANGWEVAKISFGSDGAAILQREADVLRELANKAAGIPRLLGLHHSEDATVLRMPYLTGRKIPVGKSNTALALLNQWISNHDARPATEFPEWPAIESALSRSPAGQAALDQLAGQSLTPVIRHGDFARWNLILQNDGKLSVIDWEWGHAAAMPGLDLVHYFLQDLRLVVRMSPLDAIRECEWRLSQPDCQQYLKKTGWGEETLLPIIASLAFKQGAGHQDNEKVLEAGVSVIR